MRDLPGVVTGAVYFRPLMDLITTNATGMHSSGGLNKSKRG